VTDAPRCLVLQHEEVEDPARIGAALAAAGVTLDTRRPYLGQSVPADTTGYAGLVVMGGPMSARSDDGFASRRAELALVEAAVAGGTPTLGVCLGAQLLAVATGGEVRVGEAGLEVGWGPVELAPAAADDPLFSGLPATLEVLHWHGETFSLGPAAVLLASNDRYRAQAFRVGPRAWGLQFHVEVDDATVRAFVDAFADEAAVVPGGGEAIAANAATALRALRPAADTLLGRFAALVAGTGGALD
jgi:GMP synthase-like glutamine amidotransferase